MDFIYTRQSVDRPDSISVESQLEFCEYETRGGEYKHYSDKGYSGKNTDRPDFQRMLGDMKKGLCSRVIVYKLDRISRSILDFSTMMEEFKQCGVEFVSCTEKFDTSTPMGNAMLNICIVFAQLERETIQKRVLDAYSARSKRGFYMGGRIPYGYKLEPYFLDGKKTAKYAIEPEEADNVRLIFELYSDPQISFGDIVRYLFDHKIMNRRSSYWDRCRIAEMIKNPIYVKADLDVYDFYKTQEAILENDPADYIGTNGCYLYTGDSAGRKTVTLEGQHVVLAPHEGIVPSDIWLKARKKCMNNKQVAKPSKAKNSWLVGKVKCGKCGYALTIKKAKTKIGRYFICSHHLSTMVCEGVGGIDAGALEDFVFMELSDHLNCLVTLERHSTDKANPKLIALRVKESQIDAEIESLMSKLSMANDALMSYINKRVDELDKSKKRVRNDIRELAPISTDIDIKKMRNYLNNWDKLSINDKIEVLNTFVVVIKLTEKYVEFEWRYIENLT